jgi:hypothetical protein
MDNRGWELNLQGYKLVKAGDFWMDVTLNFSNYVNKILEIDDGIRPYCFLVERLGHVRCIRFKSDIARESKYEESGGKAI